MAAGAAKILGAASLGSSAFLITATRADDDATPTSMLLGRFVARIVLGVFLLLGRT